jgi:hypothetical protein
MKQRSLDLSGALHPGYPEVPFGRNPAGQCREFWVVMVISQMPVGTAISLGRFFRQYIN